MRVLAFDRDWTVDVNPHPRHRAVPLEWVRHWASETDHEVWAIGNQTLAEEADVPGVVELVERVHGRPAEAVLGEPTDGRYPDWPARRERLRLLADLFPGADGYVVVDDIDLGDVDGWDHYHAWEFVPAVERGDAGVGGPPGRDAVTDGGRPATAAVEPTDVESLRRFLDEHADCPGFEVAYDADGGTARHMVGRVELLERTLRRPAAAPAVRCHPLPGGGEPFVVRVDDLVCVTGVERAADPADVPAALDRLDAGEREVRVDALRELRALAAADPAACLPVLPLLRSLLDGGSLERPDLALGVLAAVARERPADVAPLVAEVAPYLSADGAVARRAATRCVSEVATADAGAVVDAVPALAATVEGDAEGRAHAVYALCRVADDHPEAVEPVVPVLGDTLLNDGVPDGERLNAAAALGHVAGEFPDVVLPILGDVAALTGAESAELRNNALGLLADVATHHPAAVAPRVGDVARFVDADDAFARINSTGVLSRVAETHPDVVEPYADRLVGRLGDDRALVRRNACWALGHVEAEGAVDALESVAAADASDEVRERARWAVDRVGD